jgi:hypothetical protein
MKHRWIAAALLATSALAAPMAHAQESETMLLRDPALSDNALAFVYAGDIWIAAPDGSNPVRLTSHPADLRRDGALKRNLWARREKGWVDLRSKREVGAVSIIADVDCGRISIKGRAFGQPIDQKLEVVAQPLPYGGERFYAACPLSGKRCTVLISRRARRSLPL